MNPTTTAEKIIQSVCELQEMPALDHPETIVISVTDLRTIVENHTPAVKPLPWGNKDPETGKISAESVFGTYFAVDDQGWYVTLDDHPWGKGFEWAAPDIRMTFQDAANAAQADYEKRILSALISQPT